MYIKRRLKDTGIPDPGASHYEEKFEFTLWKMIRQRAEEKDISYSDAAAEVEPEFSRMTRIRDQAYTDEQIRIGETT